MESCRTADKPTAGQHSVPLDTQQVDAVEGVLTQFIQGDVRIRMETAGVRVDRYCMERDKPAGDRKVLFDRDPGPVHTRQAVFRHLLVQHDIHSAACELSRAELRSGREGAYAGGLSQDYPRHDAGVIRAAFRTCRSGGLPGGCAYRSPVAGGGPLSADYLFLRLPVSTACNQSQYAAGAGAVGLVFKNRNSEKNSCYSTSYFRNFCEYRFYALGMGWFWYYRILA